MHHIYNQGRNYLGVEGAMPLPAFEKKNSLLYILT